MNRRRRTALPYHGGRWTPAPRPEIRSNVLVKFSSDPCEQPLVLSPEDAARAIEAWPQHARIADEWPSCRV